MTLVNTQLTYILHKRNYRESSQILEIFSRDYGRLSLLSRGSRGPKSKIAGNLQLFSPLLISWQPKASLPVTRGIDRADIKPPVLGHRALLSAMYINELLMYLLHRHDVQSDIFDLYHQTLYRLEHADRLEIALRRFELHLLKYLGFGLVLDKDADSGLPVHAHQNYHYHIEHGPVICSGTDTVVGRSGSLPVLQGQTLLLLMQEEFQQLQQNRSQRQQVKLLMRHVISFYLNGRPLKSRELFSPPQASMY